MEDFLQVLDLRERTEFFPCADARLLGADGVRTYARERLGITAEIPIANSPAGLLAGDRAALFSHLVVLQEFLASNL